MIVGVGTDLCGIGRIARAMENERFALRVFTPAERARLDGLCPERVHERAAGMFAAKEAVAKALGTGFRGFTTRDISVEPDALGRPAVRLSGGALERLHTLGAQSVMISITHTGGFAAAVAVIE